MRSLLVLLFLSYASMVQGADLSWDKTFHVGGGFGFNQADVPSTVPPPDPADPNATAAPSVASAILLQAGVDVERDEFMRGGFEIGYVETSDLKADVGWASAVFGWRVAPYVEVLGRLGLDLGDIEGIHGGIGIGHFIERDMQVRLEGIVHQKGGMLVIGVRWYPGGWAAPAW